MKTKFLILSILAAILFTALATATVYESNYVYDGIIKADGTETKGTTTALKPITGVSVVGYTCQDEACETATRLWPNTMNTGNDNIIVLSYPTELQSQDGYLVYFFKKGYVPYAVRADWYGEGNAGSYNNYLRKFETGSAQIANFKISDTNVQQGETITITADILSPSVYTKNWYVPDEVKKHLKDKVEVTLEIDGEIVKTKTLNIKWSTQENVEFSWTPDEEGEYIIRIITEITDNKFLDSEIKTQKIEIKVTEEEPVIDTTAPRITISYPKDKTYDSHITHMNYMISDENLEACWYSTDGTKIKIENCQSGIYKSISLDSVEGKNTWTIYAQDKAGNKAEKTIIFYVDLEDDEEGGINRGYRDLHEEDTWEDEQYYNQFKDNKKTTKYDGVVKFEDKNYYILASIILFILIVCLIFLILIIKGR